jgi:hypothetical protein
MEVMRTTDIQESSDTRDTLCMFGGAALMILGAGLILSSPTIRKYLGGFDVSNLLRNMAPDFQRYLKLKSM